MHVATFVDERSLGVFEILRLKVSKDDLQNDTHVEERLNYGLWMWEETAIKATIPASWRERETENG